MSFPLLNTLLILIGLFLGLRQFLLLTRNLGAFEASIFNHSKEIEALRSDVSQVKADVKSLQEQVNFRCRYKGPATP